MVTAYIGDLNDPNFNWNNCDSIGNIPRGLGPELPPSRDAWSLIYDKIENGEFHGKQLDWGAYAAQVNKSQIISFIDELYGNPVLDLINKIDEFKDFVAGLDDNKLYALVACELY